VFAPEPGAGAGAGAARDRRIATKELRRLERQIDRLGVREKELTEELAARASDYEALIGLGAQLREVQAEQARLEEEWLAVAEDAE
jgi:ATP-binding cassette subfamily F protein uup